MFVGGTRSKLSDFVVGALVGICVGGFLSAMLIAALIKPHNHLTDVVSVTVFGVLTIGGGLFCAIHNSR